VNRSRALPIGFDLLSQQQRLAGPAFENRFFVNGAYFVEGNELLRALELAFNFHSFRGYFLDLGQLSRLFSTSFSNRTRPNSYSKLMITEGAWQPPTLEVAKDSGLLTCEKGQNGLALR
jgi:hypothetical protein